MNMRRICLRYYPPGIALELANANADRSESRHIDLFNLNRSTNVDDLARSIIFDNQLHSQQANEETPSSTSATAMAVEAETTITANAASITGRSNVQQMAKPSVIQKQSQAVIPMHTDTFTAVRHAIKILQQKVSEPRTKKFYLFKCLQQHILPLTNVAFDRSGERYLTCSYDRTCRIFNTNTAEELHILRGHQNVVFSAGFNFPKCDKVVTSSFDATAKVWSCIGSYEPSKPLATLCGHTAEIVAAEFDSVQAKSIVTASLDGTARIFDVETSLELRTNDAHNAEVIASRFCRCNENLILTGSFDRTAAIWDVRQERPAAQLSGHTAELSNCIWNYGCDLIATGSLDSTARLWDVRCLGEKSLFIVKEHSDEVLDIAFDYIGKRLATSSSDCTARIWNTSADITLQAVMEGHSDEVSKVCFSPPGGLLLTASADRTARLWYAESGECFQTLAGHESEVFSCAFNYAGDAIITASKDNTCRLWR